MQRGEASVLTSQLSILRATVASGAIPEKERIICVGIYRLDKLITCTTFGEVFIDPHLQRKSRDNREARVLYEQIYTLIDHFVYGV